MPAVLTIPPDSASCSYTLGWQSSCTHLSVGDNVISDQLQQLPGTLPVQKRGCFSPTWASQTQPGLLNGRGDKNSITGWCTRNLWVSGSAQLVTGTLAFHALTPTPRFILTWAFHEMPGTGRRCPGYRTPISTSWDPISSDSHPMGPLWQLLPLTVPTKGDAFQEKFWGFAILSRL